MSSFIDLPIPDTPMIETVTTTVIPAPTTTDVTTGMGWGTIILIILFIGFLVWLIWYFFFSKPKAGIINAVDAHYGVNCNPALGLGDATGGAYNQIFGYCNGKTNCTFNVVESSFGDPVPGCDKNLDVKYSCTNHPNNVYNTIYYENDAVNFDCNYGNNMIYISSASYGTNCDSKLIGNATRAVQKLCDGKSQCTFDATTGSFARGVDLPNCTKKMTIDYRCGSDPSTQTLSVNENDLVNIYCP
jgi:hypothetical protein